MGYTEKTDYLIETKGLLKDRINSLGGSITSGTTFRDYLVWLDSLYEALEEKTITGLPDSLEGKCEQTGTPTPTSPKPINITTGGQVVSVCQKNLLNIQTIVKGRLDSGVIGYASNTTDLTLNDNSFAFTTNASYRGVTSGYMNVGTATNICFSSDTNKTTLSIKCACYDENKNWLSDGTFHNISDYACYFTLANNTKYIRMHILLNSSGTITINNPQIEYGNQATTYEAYTGNDYEINLGKNLFNPNNITSGLFYNTSNGSETSSGVWSQSSFIGVSGGTKISISSNYSVANNSYEISQFNESKQWLQGEQFSLNTSKTYTLNANAKYIRIGFRSDRDTTDKLQIEKNDQATSYAEYKTPIYLGEIGNYKDYIFRNTTENPLYDSNLEEGQWYIHKEIGRVVLNGSESYEQFGSQTLTNTCLFGTTIIDNILNIGFVGLSNYFENSTTSIWNTDVEKMQINATGTNKIRFRINKSIASTTSALNTWLSSHNVEVYYVLNTPTNILIEDEELINQLNEIEIFTVISEDFYN